MYLVLYSTSQRHTVSTAALQSVLTCFHRSLLDMAVDLLLRWDSKILSHMAVEASFLMCKHGVEYVYVRSSSMLCYPAIIQPIGITLMLTIETIRACLAVALALSGLVAAWETGCWSDTALEQPLNSFYQISYQGNNMHHQA